MAKLILHITAASKKLFRIAVSVVLLLMTALPINLSAQSLARITDHKQLSDPEPKVDFKVYNNPCSTKITIVYDANEAGKGLFNIFYSDGRLLARREVVIVEGINAWDYYFPSNATGFFLIEFTTKNIVKTAKVLKTNLVGLLGYKE